MRSLSHHKVIPLSPRTSISPIFKIIACRVSTLTMYRERSTRSIKAVPCLWALCTSSTTAGPVPNRTPDGPRWAVKAQAQNNTTSGKHRHCQHPGYTHKQLICNGKGRKATKLAASSPSSKSLSLVDDRGQPFPPARWLRVGYTHTVMLSSKMPVNI